LYSILLQRFHMHNSSVRLIVDIKVKDVQISLDHRVVTHTEF